MRCRYLLVRRWRPCAVSPTTEMNSLRKKLKNNMSRYNSTKLNVYLGNHPWCQRQIQRQLSQMIPFVADGAPGLKKRIKVVCIRRNLLYTGMQSEKHKFAKKRKMQGKAAILMRFEGQVCYPQHQRRRRLSRRRKMKFTVPDWKSKKMLKWQHAWLDLHLLVNIKDSLGVYVMRDQIVRQSKRAIR